MEKEIFTMEQISELDNMTIMHFAAPVIVASVLIEWLVGVRKKRDYYDKRDFMAAVAIGVGSVILGALLKVTIFYITLVIYNAVPWAIPRSWWGFVLAFLLVDFCRYWAHRISHEQRFWWATHVTHHSSRKMNFSVSFRTGWTQHIKFIFFLPVPFLGFDPFTFFICHQLAVLYQFWVHTELIGKLPAPLEYVFVTPSHHRVHHGSNPKYIDKNYGSTLIIWDRLFNTFQVEEERPTYGITKPVTSYNPIYLVFHEWVDIWQDLRHVRLWREVWDLLFKPPGAVVTAYQREQEALFAQDQGQIDILPALQVAPALPVEQEDNEELQTVDNRQVG
ncbi:sterol desaturase family protein [Pontibacter sp. JH31]|uniref:Sterol desaturase family protein n=1 Tax=Pontibacter aquaedesilientis TaxID=2766980 RepID=A0ABR7XBD7_9BACT|nr:sterol desaturase family protein [Pontibacter aquaedesilientis]MBD1395592.1 sterol desaturase family protein [Pontibacter aquaedesilientis]